ncbi:MAG TPA: hypothetical protein VIU64_22450 [Polyangia bacterium]
MPAPKAASAGPRTASEDDPTPVEAMRLDVLPVADSRAEDDRTPVEEPPPAILRAAATPRRGSARPAMTPRAAIVPRPPVPGALPGVPSRAGAPGLEGGPRPDRAAAVSAPPAATTPTPRAMASVPVSATAAAPSAGFPVAPLGNGVTPTPTPTASSAGAPVALAPTGSAGSWRPLPGSGPAILPPPVMSAPPPRPSRWPFVAGVALLLGGGGALAAWRLSQPPTSVAVVAPVRSTPGVITEPTSPQAASAPGPEGEAEPKPNAKPGRPETRAETRAPSKTAGAADDGVAAPEAEGTPEGAGRARRSSAARLAYREQEREPAHLDEERAASPPTPPAPTPEEPLPSARPSSEATLNQENKGTEAVAPPGPAHESPSAVPPRPPTAPAEPAVHEAASGKDKPLRREGQLEAGVAAQPPKALSTQAARQQLLIDPNDEQYKVKLTPALERAGMNFWAVLKICVSAQGNVTDVKIVRPADPAIDSQFPSLIGRWKYRPYLVDGKPTAFCYLLRYEIDTR